MPWKIEDVDKKKKGLNPQQKKKWVRIANHVLKTCMKDGGKDCESMAIKIASEKSIETKRVLK